MKNGWNNNGKKSEQLTVTRGATPRASRSIDVYLRHYEVHQSCAALFCNRCLVSRFCLFTSVNKEHSSRAISCGIICCDLCYFMKKHFVKFVTWMSHFWILQFRPQIYWSSPLERKFRWICVPQAFCGIGKAPYGPPIAISILFLEDSFLTFNWAM